MCDLELIKSRLRAYSRDQIEFNEPHFSQQLILREGSREQVVSTLQNPESLVSVDYSKGKYGDIIHNLNFRISSSRTLRLPVIFDYRKGLYIITYIMRYRKWLK